MRTKTNLPIKAGAFLGMAIVACFRLSGQGKKGQVDLLFNKSVAPVQFAVSDISKALDSKGFSATDKELSAVTAEAGKLRIVIGSSAEEDGRLSTERKSVV